MQSTATNPKEMIAAAGIRPSVHRVAVLSYVMQHRTHPSVDEIYAHLSQSMSSLSRTTVYNALKTLTDAGLVRTIDATTDGTTHYDSTHHSIHAHFVCRRCNCIIDIPNLPSMPLPSVEGLKIENAAIYYKGLCPECQKKDKQQIN